MQKRCNVDDVTALRALCEGCLGRPSHQPALTFSLSIAKVSCVSYGSKGSKGAKPQFWVNVRGYVCFGSRGLPDRT